ncbi:hypothetical protein DAEQUDRAFT_720113 [Daedalea quercina L-15889]|uniref:RNA polymerase II subunit A C-terminal domain phosphatase n=1 Tax=Daedalea quercina L-15889 TaxID=1314783 RepID=A0A165UHT7_9APHY|nr:hypothetical protein DAEQUDRAFT_720113 [Daedalea quercina L-15889]
MTSSTELFLPPELPYPIKITAHAVEPDASVARGARLLSYSYAYFPPDASEPERRFGTWDSSVEGTIERWGVKPGETVSARKAKEVPAIYITEPCKHGVQLGGLCCLCGKDMTDYDYTGFSDTSRASIQMTHLANGPLVSLEEAQRIEQETAQHLLKSRKLSLIVDLDQTIVHATVDPTVGEWIAEGEAWEARQAQKAEAAAQHKEGDSDDTASDEDDEVNPNWEALKDVKKFLLGPEALGQPSFRSPKGKGKEKAAESEGCMYYIKPRPGWEDFLQTMATKYEMHVYTMGTRAYAEEVCAAIDPEGKIFGGRILSRDESGSLTQKSLQRLFPSDQSMVVIIDDRADVWEWSPNLVKVIPYDFFVGIGDINSAFLPKLEPMTPVLPTPTPSPSQETVAESQPSEEPSAEPPSSPAPRPATPPPESPTPSLSMSETSSSSESLSADDVAKSIILQQNTAALEAQVEDRPLAKKQEELEEQSAAQRTNGHSTVTATNGSSPPQQTAAKQEKVVRKALLNNNDTELQRVQKILEEVHQRFYDEYDARSLEPKPSKRKGTKQSEPASYDVRTIIPRMRMDTLDGCHILFSSVIPLDTRPEATEIWKTAHAFGAKCYTELSNRITHVVAAKRGTQKVDAARRMGTVKVVWLAWFTDSIAEWARRDENPYLLDPDPPPHASAASPPSDAHQISSDPEPDADDWDEERVPAPEGGGEGLALNEVNWDEINDEVDAAMNESDDDDDDGASERGGARSGNVSEDEGSWTDESNSIISSTTSSPRNRRKRLRSLTPSEVGLNGSVDSDVLRSPLAKRKKLVADRSGTSKLKEAFTADELAKGDSLEAEQEGTEAEAEVEAESVQQGSSPTANDEDDTDDSDDTDDDNNTPMDEDDDFLARELEEEWG